MTRHSIFEGMRSLSVLLAEDDPLNQTMAAFLLRKRGHSVDIASDGRQAVEATARRAYDVVLMDLQMPQLDGFEATAEIRAQSGRHVPIVALTANDLSGERDRCIAAGMDDYLCKPFTAQDLFAIVEGWGAGGAEKAARAQAPRRDPSRLGVGGGEPAVDVDGLRAELRTAGVEEMLEPMMDLFLRGARGRLTALAQAVRSGEAGSIDRAAHAFKSSAGAVRAKELASLLGQAETAARSGDAAGASALHQRIVDAAREAIDYLTAQGFRMNNV